MSLVEIIIPVVGGMQDKAEALAFVEMIANKVKGAKDKEAFILTKVITADIQLNPPYENRDKVKVRKSPTSSDSGLFFVHL